MARNPVEKKAQNEALLREVNERIEKVVDDAANPEFLCECADEECCEMLELSIAEYEAIRSSPVRFPVAPPKSCESMIRAREADGFGLPARVDGLGGQRRRAHGGTRAASAGDCRAVAGEHHEESVPARA